MDEIEDLHDDMADLMEDTNEVNDILSRSYGVPEDLNEEDLMAELNALDDELLSEPAEAVGADEVPAYLLPALKPPTVVPNANRPSPVVAAPSAPSAPPGGGSQGGGGTKILAGAAAALK